MSESLKPAVETTDPYRWLEDVQGERSLAWVRERNAATERVLISQPGFDTLRTQIREVLDSKVQIPQVSRRGAWFYNLWRDADHPRGLWRRTTLDEYRKAEPAWDTVIDLDALGKAEGENWVWGGATCLGPDYRRCLVSLSRGGADAHVVREFDTVEKQFIADGFKLPEAKSDVRWIDADHLLVGTDFGDGSLTDSGYPRVIRQWARGTALDRAKTVFEAETADVAASVRVDRTPGFERTVFHRAVDFYRSVDSLWLNGALQRLPKPDDARLAFDRQHVLIELRSDWSTDGRTWPGGSLLLGDAAAFIGGRAVAWTALFTPTPTRALASWTATRSTVLVSLLDDVASRLEAWHRVDGHWQQRVVDAPHPGSLSVTALHDPELADDPLAESYLLQSADFLNPDSLQLATTANDRREPLKTRPTFFDATGMRVEQRFVRSTGGARVPYFVVWPKGAKPDGRNPTLLSGYGGFEISRTPFYSGVTGRLWTGRGGVWVLANIRGGGEYGPAWHQAAVREGKQKSYDDFAAVAQDLIDTGVTQRGHLAIQGGSNGGLLVGAVMLQHPELFGAVVCQVPLLDMQRYHKLLAGASWMAEYGNPDLPTDWEFMRRYSPYQNVQPDTDLPAVLFTTSTRDDRVHPGHARKMAARMLAQGHDVLLWENIEGGHGGAADNAQRATMLALEYAFLWRQIGPAR
ncbi:MAG: prolyl oligopeptidase family serine peptidase [Rubrivivax sp.]